MHNEYLLYLIKDVCLYRLLNGHSNKPIKKYNNYLLVNHVNGLIDDININKMIHSKTSYNLFPACKDYILHTGTTYKYSNTIRSKITNYINTVNNTNWNIQCFCQNHKEFIDPCYDHIITGNIDIIKNKDIKNLLVNGLGFREKKPHNKARAYSSVQSAIDKFIYNISQSSKTPSKMFNPWKKYILDRTRDILWKCINRHSASNVLNKKVNMDYLNEFHNQFVIVPVDKASKRYCM